VVAETDPRLLPVADWFFAVIPPYDQFPDTSETRIDPANANPSHPENQVYLADIFYSD
jgi:hypothetical protein